ncbi:MAG TPA: hypothetical protein VE996_05945 [Terriglobales bacterium]|nr:hypothetical protein [Terriglobales bacterium]
MPPDTLQHLLIVSAHFSKVPLALRERLALGDQDPHPAALLARMPGIEEAMWLEAFDRVAAVLLAEDELQARRSLARLWDPRALAAGPATLGASCERCAIYRGEAARHHLLGSLAWLDAAFPGSLYLRREFREAWRMSWQSGGMKAKLDLLCREVGSLAETLVPDPAAGYWPAAAESRIAPAEAAPAALAVARAHLAPLPGRRALVLGTGSLAARLARALHAAGARVAIPGVHSVAARDLAQSLGAEWATMSELAARPRAYDVVLNAAADRHRWGFSGPLQAPLMLDFAFPRALAREGAAGTLFYDVDDLARQARALAQGGHLAPLRRPATALPASAQRPLMPAPVRAPEAELAAVSAA